MKEFVTNNFRETQKLGEQFAKRFHLDKGGTLSSTVIALYGDLGSGKTTFVQGMAKGLGIKRRIISPTFIIVRTYELQVQNSKLKTQNYNSKLKSLERFYHIDLYRIQSEKEVKDLGIEEIMNDPQNIVAIEWAEKMGELLPEDRIDIRFDFISESKRRIMIDIKYKK